MKKNINIRPDYIILDGMKFGEGLQPTPTDERDFSLGGVFGTANLDEIPMTDWLVAQPLEIKDQSKILPDGCTGFSLATVNEAQEGVILDPGFAFAMIKKMQGDYRTWGGDLRAGCKVATNVGFIKQGDNPMDFGAKSRNFIANWLNWPLDLLLPKASKYRKASFFKVDGPYDTFDNFRAALWANREEGRLIYTGCVWRPGWMYTDRGIIPKTAKTGGVGHAFAVIGQKVIDGEIYLVVQNSYGPDAGDKGFHYFPRSVVNREFTYNGYMFKDMPKEEAKEILRGKGLLVEPNPSLWDKIVSWIIGLFQTP